MTNHAIACWPNVLAGEEADMGRGHETSAEGEGRVQFRLTCPRHRAMFIEIVKREGVSDEAEWSVSGGASRRSS